MEENTNEGYDSTKKKTDSTAENFEKEAKSTTNEFKEGWNQATNSGDNKKLMAGILAIVLGSLGIHKFILGYNKEGIILLVATLIGYATSCLGVGVFILMATGIVGLIEGIIYLTKSDEEFYNTYQVGQKPWF
ncbi:TM2 domain-containing protein [uncultured Marixanthomonas sp.]|uniref:TM2 domain-containing protein n=1 Tax=uncultured Marixanthomonas sp. TaxID=757245 RepID=UPI0030DA4CA3|tara:strand:+ start:51452 stop:51850 length:399 start_codon:yes stop_codon:yes gene_type:complete